VVHPDISKNKIFKLTGGERVLVDTLILCIGNREGGDDGIGPYIADKMKDNSYSCMVLDCGITLENYTAVVK